MKKLEQPLISIIVPVYKVEKYLKRCVDSILTQTYQNMEVILVDDGSPDNCGAICDRYKETDNRVVVIHKKNGGLSDARNAAIPLAKGEYIIVRKLYPKQSAKQLVKMLLIKAKIMGGGMTNYGISYVMK
jgi:cellulose synthase/poly-beta-1,6-N-acetylglucosamine synthase-like glycosyltransferase